MVRGGGSQLVAEVCGVSATRSPGYDPVILPTVKTAISIPDELFAAGDRLARRLGLSRSELYARALSRYLAGADDSDVTDALDQVYADDGDQMDPGFVEAQRRALDQES